MRIATLILLWTFVFSVGIVQAQTPVPQDMPAFVLRAAQTLNAQYGPIIDLNNVVWDYKSYDQLEKATVRCPNLGQQPPPLPAGTSVSIVELKPVRDGQWGHEIWFMLVYNDLSLVTTCQLPPTPIPTPTLRPFATAAPPTIPPTPTATFTPSLCPGVLASRLVIGQQGRVVANGMPNIMRSVPGTSGEYLGEIPAGGTFAVLNGPRCFSNYAWWQVNYNGIVGWTAESDNQDYWLEPAALTVQATVGFPTAAFPSATAAFPTAAMPTRTSMPPTAAYPTRTLAPPVTLCNPNAPARLQPGQFAQVTPGYPNNLRANPGTSSQYVGEIQPQQPFLVLAGPECASGMAWWKVDYNGLVGWTPEGETANDYWLEPLASRITYDNAAQLRQLSTIQLSAIDQIAIVPNSPYQFTLIDTNSTLVYAAQPDTTGVLHWQPAPVGELLPGQRVPQTAFTPVPAPMLIPVLDEQNRLLLNGYGDTPVIASEVGSISAAAAHPLGLWVAASVNGELRVWSYDGTLQTLTGGTHTSPVGLVRFSLDGSLLASSSTSETILWNTSTWTARQIIQDGVGATSGQLALRANTLALSDRSKPGVRLYDVSTGASVNLPTTSTMTALAFSPTQDLLVMADVAGQIQVWDGATSNLVTTLVKQGNPVQEMAFSPDGDALFILDQSGVLGIWLVAPG